MQNKENVVVIKIDESLRDFIQRLHLEWYQKDRVVRGLLEDHQYDTDPEQFLNSPSFKAYEKRCEKALLAYETATEDMKNQFLPESFKNIDNFQWNLDYNKCELTFKAL